MRRTHATTERVPLARRLRLRLARGGEEEGGFILLETMVALTLITVIMSAVGTAYVNSMLVSVQQRSMTTAAQLASSAMTDIRALDPSDLLSGRSKTTVQQQRARLALVPKVARWLVTSDANLAFDNTPLDVGTSAAVSTTAGTTILRSKAFTVDKYLECRDAVTTPVGLATQDCGDPTKSNALRAVVSVVWKSGTCPSTGCAFVSSTLIDTHVNPTFDINQPLPPAPVPVAVGDQPVSIGDTENLQLLTQDGKGAAPFTWAVTNGTLPAGLELSPAGLLTGTFTGPARTSTVTFTVTDAFLRTAPLTVRWIVTAPVTVTMTPSGDRASVTGTAISPISQTKATGGSGSYTYSDPGKTLPTGLTLNTSTGVIAGTATVAGTYTVSIAATDNVGRTGTTGFSWVVGAPLVISDPGTQVATVGAEDQINLTASGGTAPYSWSATTPPNGMSWNRVGTDAVRLSGTPTSPTSAAGVELTVSVTDSKGLSYSRKFTLRVVAAPTMTAPASQQTTTGGAARAVTVVSTCANTPCSYRLDKAPAGLSIDGSGQISGTVSSSAQSFTNVRVTVTDAVGASAESSAFTWTINRAPSLSSIENRTDARGVRATQAPPTISNGTGPFAFSATGLPSGVSINTSTGQMSGTTANANSAPTTTVTVVDASGVRVTTSFQWYVSDLKLDFPATVPVRLNETANYELKDFTTGGSRPYVAYDADIYPRGIDIKGTRIVGKFEEKKSTVVTIRVTDSTGAFFDETITVNVS